MNDPTAKATLLQRRDVVPADHIAEKAMAATTRTQSARQIVVHPPRAFARVTLVCCLILIGVGIYLRVIGEDELVAWGVIALSGGTGFLFAPKALDWRPRLVIDDAGVLDRTLGIGLIRWDEVRGTALDFVDGKEFVCLQVQNPEKSDSNVPAGRRKLAAANRDAGFAEVTLDLSGVSMATEDVVALIQQR